MVRVRVRVTVQAKAGWVRFERHDHLRRLSSFCGAAERGLVEWRRADRAASPWLHGCCRSPVGEEALSWTQRIIPTGGAHGNLENGTS